MKDDRKPSACTVGGFLSFLLICTSVLIVLSGCDDHSAKDTQIHKLTEENAKLTEQVVNLEQQSKVQLDFIRGRNEEPSIWKAGDNLSLTPVKVVGNLDYDKFVDVMNEGFNGQPKVVFKEAGLNYVVVSVDDPEMLTQRMGTTGAKVFMAEVTYSLTSFRDVDYVQFEFPAGDHAWPGVYSRADFMEHGF